MGSHTRHTEAVSSSQCKMDSFKGKFERTSAEKYEEFLKALDVNFLLRKAATVSTPVMEVSEEAGVWTIKTSTTLKSMELKFKVGDEFVCVQKAKKDGQKSTKSIREFTADECILTMTIDGMDDLVCVQKFKRV